MRRVIPPDIQFYYVNQSESKQRLETIYDRIFKIARENIANKSKQKELKNEHRSSRLTIKDYKSNMKVERGRHFYE